MTGRRRGFTLIEVLVALAIVTIGMSVVLKSLTSAADTVYYLRDKTFAEWIALNRIAETRLQVQLPKKGKTSGELDFAGRKWFWQQEVSQLEVQGMWRIEVSARPKVEGVAGDSAETNSRSWYATKSGVAGDAIDRLPSQPQIWNLANGKDGPGSDRPPGPGPGPENDNGADTE